MKPSVLPAVGLAVLWLAAPSAAPGTEQPPSLTSLLPADPLDALQKALHAEHEAKMHAGGPAAGGGRETYEARSYLEGIRQSMSRGDDRNALSTIHQIEDMSSTEEVHRACAALVDKINKDHTAREQAYVTELDVAIKRAGEIALRAKDPKELDGPITDFNRLAESRTSSDNRDSRTQQKIQGGINFLNHWQEYLAAHVKGDDAAATNALQNLGSGSSGLTMFVPRSEVLARMPGSNRRPPAEVSAIVADVLDHTRTLDDIPATLSKLSEYGTHNNNGSTSFDGTTDLGVAVYNLQAIQKVRAELQAGIATTINVNTLRATEGSTRAGIEGKLTGLRAELIKATLPRLLDAADERPTEGESVNDFLRRLIELAKKRGDWPAVARGLDLGRNLAPGQNNYTTANAQETEAFRQFFAGLNLEAAGQYAQAVLAYLGALKTGAQELPASVVGEHLAAIEKAHPQEFAEANAALLNPPPSPSGIDPARNRRANYPPTASDQPTPPTTITLPAVAAPTPAVSTVVQPK